MRDDVDLPSRAGDQKSTDLGWIPDFITELQHDLDEDSVFSIIYFLHLYLMALTHGQIALEVLSTTRVLNLVYWAPSGT